MILAKEWVEAGGVRSPRRRESNGEGPACAGFGLCMVFLFRVGHMRSFWVRQFDSPDDEVPTLALYERPAECNAVVRPLSSAHQFTRDDSGVLVACLARISSVFSVNSAWKITFQWLLKLKAFKGKGVNRCARTGFEHCFASCGGGV